MGEYGITISSWGDLGLREYVTGMSKKLFAMVNPIMGIMILWGVTYC